ncbi:rhomboid protease AarA [bacterium BMS3Abin05]|nr:rhomboid protease AarA [bacterium BMS3Abin05]GBE27714.1 rhomboid protease AarA [bacterium BMS3Bbin03]
MKYYAGENVQFGLGARLTNGVKYLLIANAAVYLLELVFKQQMFYWFALNPQMILHSFAIWQFFTYMFLHANLLHIMFNMFVLWIFGAEVEDTWGTRPFLKYYFITGVGAGIIDFLVYWAFGINAVTIGASGAIYGLIIAFAIIFPNRYITLLIFFILPVTMKAPYLAAMMALISIFSGVSNLFGAGDNIAHFAHLGGMLVGYLFLKTDLRRTLFEDRFKRQMKLHRVKKDIKEIGKMRTIEQRVDEILDKINEVGYDALTKEEKKILKRASDFFSKGDDKQ